jgi:Glycosyltransferase (GlcNAc)
MKIFVNIVSYRDPLLKYTVHSLLDSKSNRYEIIIGIFEQTALQDSLLTVDPDLLKLPNIKYKRIDPEYSDGVCWARYNNFLQIDDEDYIYQVDSHMMFDQNWDRALVNDWRIARNKTNSDKVIITASCKSFSLDSEGKPVVPLTAEITSKTRYFIYQPNHILGAHGEHIPSTGEITPAIHICAGNFFTTAKWVTEVGVDPHLFFEGEEQMMTLQSFIAGYKLFHPKAIRCYHLNDTHNYPTKQWFNPVVSMERYAFMVNRGYKYWVKFLDNLDEDLLIAYHKATGVDYIHQKLEKRAITTDILLPPDVVDTWTTEDTV